MKFEHVTILYVMFPSVEATQEDLFGDADDISDDSDLDDIVGKLTGSQEEDDDDGVDRVQRGGVR